MELVRGTPLDDLLRFQGPIPLERFVPLLDRVCEVVHTAHEQGIVHRDLKPGNVMVVARAGTVFAKLLDLGIAVDLSHAAVELHLHAEFLQRDLRLLGGFLWKRAEQAALRLHQDHPHGGGVDGAEIARNAPAGDLAHRARQFHAGGAAADHHKREFGAASLRIGLALRGLDGHQHTPAFADELTERAG